MRITVRIPPQPGVGYSTEVAASMVGSHLYIEDEVDIGEVLVVERRLRGAALLLTCEIDPAYRLMAETGAFRLGRGNVE